MRWAINRNNFPMQQEGKGASKIERSENSAYRFEDLLRPGTRKICVICFGPIEKKESGYFIRTWKVVESLSKGAETITVLEFPEDDSPLGTYQKDNIIFIRLKGNRVIDNNSTTSTVFKKRLTFDPLRVIIFQFYSAIELFRYRKVISHSDLVIVEGALIPAANFIAKIYSKKVILD